MKALILITSLLLGLTAAHARVGFGNDIQVIDLSPIASVKTSGDSSAADLQTYEGNCALVADVSAPVSGDSTTLALKLTNSTASAGTYTDVVSGDFTTVTTAASVQKIVINKNKIKRYVKLNRVIGGTGAPNYLVSAKMLCEKKYK